MNNEYDIRELVSKAIAKDLDDKIKITVSDESIKHIKDIDFNDISRWTTTEQLYTFSDSIISDPMNISYEGDLEKYFEEVKKCKLSNNLLNILSDMYDLIKK